VHQANEPLLENLERAHIQLDIDEEEAYNLEVKNHEIFFEGNMEQKKETYFAGANSSSLENTVVLWFDLVVKYEASCWEIEMQFWSDCVPLYKPQLTCKDLPGSFLHGFDPCHLLTTSC
jgi:hypothetical protein